MIIACPNLANPEVKQEFDELISVLGEKAAYAAWALNDGNMIDRAPNGAPSILFQSLLSKNKNDRTAAIREKAEIYKKSFNSWFTKLGDEAKELFTDANGEPLTEVLDENFKSISDILIGKQDPVVDLEDVLPEVDLKEIFPEAGLNEVQLEELQIIKDALRDSKGRLLAPNGKPSNLNEHQYAQVRTKAFIKWFGDWLKEYTPQKDIWKENPWESYIEFEDTGRTYIGHSGKTIPIIINKGARYVHPVERITPTNTDPFGFNSYRVNKVITVGREIDADRTFEGICQTTALACKFFLKNRYGIESSIAIINAKSPVKNDIIEHYVNILSINGEAYIYDMPQTEYIKRTKPLVYDGEILDGYYEGVIVSKYTPRLIKVTKENLSKFYEDDDKNDQQLKVIQRKLETLNNQGESVDLGNLQYKPAYTNNVSKVVDENGEPLVVYHGSNYKNDKTLTGDWSANALPYATYFAPYSNYANFKHTYQAFLNIKNPIYDDGDLTGEAIHYKEFFDKYIINKGYDGAIGGTKGFNHRIPSNAVEAIEIVAIDPNQVKSATGNIGTFSKTNNNIYARRDTNSKLINAIASTHRQLKQIPKKVNTTRFGGDNIYYQLRKALPKEIVEDIVKFYYEEKDRDSFLDRVEFYINNELKQSVMPKVIAAAKERQLELSTHYDARQITAQLFGALKSGRITGDVEADEAFIGHYQTQLAQQLFPVIYKKGWSKQRYGYYAKQFSQISKAIQTAVTQYNNARIGNLNHIYKLEAVVAGMKNVKFKQHLIEYITAVDRTTPRNRNNAKNPDIKIEDDRISDFKAPHLKTTLLNFGNKKRRSLKETLADIKQRTNAYDEIIDVLLNKMKGDTVVKLNMHVSYMAYGVTHFNKYDLSSSTVYIAYDENNDESDFIQTIIHEAIHVVTVQYLRNNPQYSQLFDKYTRYLRGIGNKQWLGNENAEEMIAEFFSNAEYREWLKTVPAPKTKMSKLISMFDKIVDFIVRIFTGDSKNAYEQIKPALEYILNEGLSNTTVSEYNPNGEAVKSSYRKSVQTISEQVQEMYDDIQSQKREYLDNIKAQHKKNTGVYYTPDQINRITVQYDQNQLSKQISTYQKTLAQLHGLIFNGTYYESTGRSLMNGVVEYVVNALDQSTFSAYRNQNIDRYSDLTPEHMSNVTEIIRNAFVDGDIQTLDKQLALTYVRMFWQTPLIQQGLQLLDDGSKNSNQLETELVNLITEESLEDRIHNKTLRDYLNSFWVSLKNIVQKVFNPKNINQQQSDEIFKAIKVAQLYDQELKEDSSITPIYDRANGNFTSSLLLSEQDKKIIPDVIKHGKTRLSALRAKRIRNERKMVEIRNQTEQFEELNGESVVDTYNTVIECLVDAENDFRQTLNYMDGLTSRDISSWNPEQILAIGRDLIGHYVSLLTMLHDTVFDKHSAIGAYNDIITDPDSKHYDDSAINIKNHLKQTMQSITAIQRKYNKEISIPYARYFLHRAIDDLDRQGKIKDIDAFKRRADQFLEGGFENGGLSAGEIMVGFATKSNSNIVRVIIDIIQNIEGIRDRKTLSKGMDLMNLYNKLRPKGSQISPINWQKQFLETDKDGVPTGYFIREINSGQFFKERDQLIEQLNNKYSDTEKYGGAAITFDDGKPVFHDDDTTANDSVYNQYYDELDEWLSDHAERRYTVDYYKNRRRYLSQDTQRAMNRIQRQIQLIRSMPDAIDEDGWFDKSKLSAQDKRLYDTLMTQKRELGSHYYFSTDNGILSLKEKTGNALRMADEISAWNEFLTKHVRYSKNIELYNKKRSEVPASKLLEFDKENTVTSFTPQFYELLQELGHLQSPELTRLQKRQREIISKLKNYQEGIVQPELTQLGTGIDKTTRSIYQELNRVETQIAQEKANLKGSAQKGPEAEFASKVLAKFLMSKNVRNNNTNSTFWNYLIGEWDVVLKANSANSSAIRKQFEDLFTIKIPGSFSRGKLSLFTILDAPSGQLHDPKTGKPLYFHGEPLIIKDNLPSQNFSELDMSSDFVNINYDVKNKYSTQPKESLYRNQKYFDLIADPNKLQLLTAMKNMMTEARSMIPNTSIYKEDEVCQMTGSTHDLIMRNAKSEIGTMLKYHIQKTFTGKYGEQTDDVETNFDLPRRPNGEVVQNIPIRWVQRLKDQRLLTTDLIGSTIAFYNMAENYALKSDVIAPLELVRNALLQAPTGENPLARTDNGNQAKKLQSLYDIHMYGHETSTTNHITKRSDTQATIIQNAKNVRKLAQKAMLGANFLVMNVGYVDAMLSAMTDAIGGRYITKRDLFWAIFNANKDMINNVRHFGNPNTNNKLGALMQLNQLSRKNSEIFSDTHKSRLSRMRKGLGIMAGYSITDYMVNSVILEAFYKNYHLMDDLNGHKRFMNSDDAIRIYEKHGYSRKEALRVWENASKDNLFNAYTQKDGKAVVKSKYQQYVTEDLQNTVMKKLKTRTASYNGMLPDIEKAKMAQNIWGSYFTMMRGFLIDTYWTRFNKVNDYAAQNEERGTNYGYAVKHDDGGFENLATGVLEGSLYQDGIRGIGKYISSLKNLIKGKGFHTDLTDNQRYAVRKQVAEIAIILGLAIGMNLFTKFVYSMFPSWDDDDKDPNWTINIFDPEDEDRNLIDFRDDVESYSKDFQRLVLWDTAALLTKLTFERTTPYWYGTIVDIIKSPTPVTSYIDQLEGLYNIIPDSFNGKLRDPITTGGYRGMTRGTKDICNVLSATGLNNIVKAWHVAGRKSSFNFYSQQGLNRFFVQSQSDYEDQLQDDLYGPSDEYYE